MSLVEHYELFFLSSELLDQLLFRINVNVQTMDVNLLIRFKDCTFF